MDANFGGDEEGEDRCRATSGSKRGRYGADHDAREEMEIEIDNGTSIALREDDDGGEGGSRISGATLQWGTNRRTLSSQDKVEIIRRRNCENARKARARKKMEVTHLQEQAAQLKLEHAQSKEKARTRKEMQTRAEAGRIQALRTFMRYRCSNVRSYEEWVEVVEESFTLTLPITPYRWFSGQDVVHNSRVLRGIHHLMTDNGSLAVLIESLGCGTLLWRREMEKGSGHGVELVCDIGDDDVVITGDTLMCCFLLRTTNAMKHGAKSEWLCRGMMSAKFSPGSNKIAAAEHVFDVTSLMQQLQKVVGRERGIHVVPNTPVGACQPSEEARVITSATPPFAVVSCNDSWTRLSGYHQDVAQGHSLSILDGPDTDENALMSLMNEIQTGHAGSSLLINYKHDGSRFLNYLRFYPLIGDSLGTVTHFLGVSQEQPEDPDGEGIKGAAHLGRPVGGVVHPAPNSAASSGTSFGTRRDWPQASSIPLCQGADSTRSSPTVSAAPAVVTSPAIAASPVVATSPYIAASPAAGSYPGGREKGLEYQSEPTNTASIGKSLSRSMSSVPSTPSMATSPSGTATVMGQGAGGRTAPAAVVDGHRSSLDSKSSFSRQASVGSSHRGDCDGCDDCGGDGAEGVGDGVSVSKSTPASMSAFTQERRHSCSSPARSCRRTVAGSGRLTSVLESKSEGEPDSEPGAFEGVGSGQDRQSCSMEGEARFGAKRPPAEINMELSRQQNPHDEQKGSALLLMDGMEGAGEGLSRDRPVKQELQELPKGIKLGEWTVEEPETAGENGEGFSLELGSRSQQTPALCESSGRTAAAVDDDVLSLCNSLGRHSAGDGDSPDPFLAWEDVLVGPGDPLQELGAACVQEELDEAGVRVTKDEVDGATLTYRVGVDMKGAGRPRAGSDSVVAVRGGSTQDRAWQNNVAPVRGDSGWVSEDMMDCGERELRAVSESAAWERAQPAAAKGGIWMMLGRTGGVAQIEGARSSAGGGASMAGLEGNFGDLAVAKLEQLAYGGYAGAFGTPGMMGVAAGGRVEQDGSMSLPNSISNDNDDLMLTQEALFRSAATVKVDGAMGGVMDPGGAVANATNITLPMLNLLDQSAMDILPYSNLVGEWAPTSGLARETSRSGIPLLGNLGGMVAAEGKGSSASSAPPLPGKGLDPGGDASAMLRFQLASSWSTMMDTNLFQNAGCAARCAPRIDSDPTQGGEQHHHHLRHHYQQQQQQQQQQQLKLEPAAAEGGNSSRRNMYDVSGGKETSTSTDANRSSDRASGR